MRVLAGSYPLAFQTPLGRICDKRRKLAETEALVLARVSINTIILCRVAEAGPTFESKRISPSCFKSRSPVEDGMLQLHTINTLFSQRGTAIALAGRDSLRRFVTRMSSRCLERVLGEILMAP